jgi:hypothetical protein
MGTLDEASFAVRYAKRNGRFPSGASAIQLAAAALPRPVAGPRTQFRGRKTRKETLMTNHILQETIATTVRRNFIGGVTTEQHRRLTEQDGWNFDKLANQYRKTHREERFYVDGVQYGSLGEAMQASAKPEGQPSEPVDSPVKKAA